MKNFVMMILMISLTFMVINCGNKTQETKELKQPQDSMSDNNSPELLPNMNHEVLNDVRFHLAYNFEEGKEFRYRLTTLSTTERDVETDSLTIDRFEQKITRVLNFKVLSLENNNMADIECTISKVYVDVNLNNQKVAYQSGVTKNPEQLKRFIEHEGLVNTPFLIRITKYGEILDISNVDAISDRYLELSGLKDSIRIEDKPVMENEIKNNLLKPLIGQVLREFPKKELGVESKWEKEIDPASIMIFKIQYTDHFTVEKIEKIGDKRIASITGDATSIIEGDRAYTTNGVNYEFADPLTEATSNIYFDIDRGLVYKGTTKTDLKLFYRMEIPVDDGTKIAKTNELITNTNIVELL
ncbi:MAG: hypothetical protein JSW63_07940 [Ignavibacterium sp.]|nr:MAG: hypothetical protein JSW63_07940 [Ignavibacterium sp.]